MSNCVVGSVGLRLPGSIIAEHSVEGSDHFSHDGNDDDLGFLVGVGKTVGEGLESGIVSACAEGLVTQTDVWVHHCAIGPSSDDGAGLQARAHSLASTNKCLARSNKSCAEGRATNYKKSICQ
jgi:hypothetical protein